MRIGVARRRQGRALDQAQGGLPIAALMRDQAEEVQRIRLSGARTKYPAIHALGFDELAAAVQAYCPLQALLECGNHGDDDIEFAATLLRGRALFIGGVRTMASKRGSGRKASPARARRVVEPRRAPADVAAILTSGGKERIALLQHCVLSVTMEPIFVFLADEYRLRPTHAGALALYDVFCAPGSPARIRADGVLPPRDLRLATAVGAIRRQCVQLPAPQQPAANREASMIAPFRGLFDFVVESLRQDTAGGLTTLAARYDVTRTPQENLPGGKLTPGQRQFLENVWKPVARPRLVAGGFWRIATIE